MDDGSLIPWFPACQEPSASRSGIPAEGHPMEARRARGRRGCQNREQMKADPRSRTIAPPGLSLTLPGREKPYVMAHRGNRVACPENTLASFRRALEDGADILETDLHLSSDGIFVCIHDGTLDRTTDGRGPVEARTLPELKALSASCGRPEFAGERIPTLAEVAALLPPDRGLALELKSDRFPRPESGAQAGRGAPRARRPRPERRPLLLPRPPRRDAARRAGAPVRLDHAEGGPAGARRRAPRAVLAAPPRRIPSTSPSPTGADRPWRRSTRLPTPGCGSIASSAATPS